MWTDIELHQDTCILRLKGRVVAGSDADYLRVRDRLGKLKFATLLVDCREVAGLDSTGVLFMLGLWRTVTEAGGQFRLM